MTLRYYYCVHAKKHEDLTNVNLGLLIRGEAEQGLTIRVL